MLGKDDPLISFSSKFNAIPTLTLAAHNGKKLVLSRKLSRVNKR